MAPTTQTHQPPLNGRVIVTYGRSIIALMIAQSLGARGAEIIGCDDVDMTILSFSNFVKAHEVHRPYEDDEDGYLEDMLRIVQQHKPHDDRPYLLIPSFHDARVLAKHRDKFDGLITIAAPDFDAINGVNPKDHLAQTMREQSVPGPKTWLATSMDELSDVIEELEADNHYPVFIKPPDEVGGRGISKVEDSDDLREKFEALLHDYPDQRLLIQTASKGVDYCFCGLFDQGSLVSSMVYYNIQKFPNEAGPGVVRETVDHQRFEEIVESLMGPLKWHGIAEIDFMWDGEDSTEPALIEVNPRFWAGLDHSIKSNVDFPWMLYQLFVDGQVNETPEPDIGFKSNMPGLSVMARLESLLTDSVDMEALAKSWPKIREGIDDKNIIDTLRALKDAADDGFSLDEAWQKFRKMRQDAKQASVISYAKDDPFIGLGVLFVLGSLIRHGNLPPEMTQ